MQTKVFFFDIDGTLVNFDGTILDSTVQALQRLKENGHKLILCTGRSKFQIYDELFRRISFDGIIAGAGTYVEYHDQILRQEQMGPDRIKKLVSYFEERGMLYSLSAPQHLICTPENEQGIAKLFAKCGIVKLAGAIVFANAFLKECFGALVRVYFLKIARKRCYCLVLKAYLAHKSGGVVGHNTPLINRRSERCPSFFCPSRDLPAFLRASRACRKAFYLGRDRARL